MIYVFLADGFEETEAIAPIDMLRRAKLDVKLVGVGTSTPTSSHGIRVTADLTEAETKLDSSVQLIVLPGGMPGTLNLEKSPVVQSAIKYCVENGIANIADFAKRVEQETGVESREAILGHVQRGGAPSAKDRVIATEMGNYCVNLLKNGISNRVVVMKETDIIDLDILEALKMEKPFEFKKYEMANMINI